MAQIEKVLTTAAPAPLPQFSQAIKYNGMVYCSGNIGILPDKPGMVQAEGTAKDRTVRLISPRLIIIPHLETNGQPF